MLQTGKLRPEKARVLAKALSRLEAELLLGLSSSALESELVGEEGCTVAQHEGTKALASSKTQKLRSSWGSAPLT